ncbi:MAG: acyl-CoA thioesterase [Armatimonadota bacterium]|nr:acyl-CoA thioesterase [Armatimonadota bacterium]
MAILLNQPVSSSENERGTQPDRIRRRFEARFRVRSYEMDSFGHMNNAVFLNYLEAARGEYLLQAGLSFNHFQEWGAFPVVRRAELSFQAALKTHDEIIITGDMEPLRRTGFRAHQQIIRAADSRVALDAHLELVFTDRNGRPIAAPEIFRKRFLEGS